MPNDMKRGRSGIVAILLLSAGCSQQVERRDSTEVLCAAEALYEARQPGASQQASDRLRERAASFRERLPASQLDQASTRIEALADQRTTEPLAPASQCSELLAQARPSERP